MIISKHFLTTDRKKVEERISFMHYCLNRSNEMLLNGEINLAELWIDEYSKCIKECEVAAFPELGCESVKKLYVEDFPLIVAIDSSGGNIFN